MLTFYRLPKREGKKKVQYVLNCTQFLFLELLFKQESKQPTQFSTEPLIMLQFLQVITTYDNGSNMKKKSTLPKSVNTFSP